MKILNTVYIPYIVLITAFLILIGFVDKNDIFTQIRITRELNKLKAEEQYFKNEIAKNRESLQKLMTDPATLEKFARETYLMKRDNEEIFLIVEDSVDIE
jgi:cell division protein FtsB